MQPAAPLCSPLKFPSLFLFDATVFSLPRDTGLFSLELRWNWRWFLGYIRLVSNFAGRTSQEAPHDARGKGFHNWKLELPTPPLRQATPHDKQHAPFHHRTWTSHPTTGVLFSSFGHVYLLFAGFLGPSETISAFVCSTFSTPRRLGSDTRREH